MLDAVRLIASIIICQAAGALGTLFTMPAISTWYENLNKPSFRPPNSVFGPVWGILYTLMGISLWLVWRKGAGTPGVRAAVIVFFIQLALNAAWSPIFFGMKNPGAGLVVIAFLLITIVFTIIKFLPVSKAAAFLLVPYLVWVSFATVLNYSIWRMN